MTKECGMIPRALIKELMQKFSRQRSAVLVMLYFAKICSKKAGPGVRRGFVEKGLFVPKRCALVMGLHESSVYLALRKLEETGFLIAGKNGWLMKNYALGWVKGKGGYITLPDEVYTPKFTDLSWVEQRTMLHCLVYVTKRNAIVRLSSRRLKNICKKKSTGQVIDVLKNIEGFIDFRIQSLSSRDEYQIMLKDYSHVYSAETFLTDRYPERLEAIKRAVEKSRIEKSGIELLTSDYHDLLQLSFDYEIEEISQALRIARDNGAYSDIRGPFGAYLRGIMKRKREDFYLRPA